MTFCMGEFCAVFSGGVWSGAGHILFFPGFPVWVLGNEQGDSEGANIFIYRVGKWSG